VSDLASIFFLSLLAMFTPTLLAAVTVMMLMPNPKRLMLGYLLGAYTTSISLGLLIAFVLGTDRDARVRERRQHRKEAKEEAGPNKESLPERLLGRGSPRITFVVGVLLTFPGVSYLTALDRMAKLDAGTAETVALVVGFCLIQQLLLELPLIGYTFAPDWTKDAVERFRAWLKRNGRRGGIIFATAIGTLLVIRGLITLLF
jgi:hypothetical protein